MKIEINIDINDRLVAFFRKNFTTRNAVFGVAALLFGLSMLLFANQLPVRNEFSSGQIISSKLVNDNFKNLWDKVNEHDTSINGLSGGSGSWWNRNEDGTIYYNQNNVGVGTANPGGKLDIYGTASENLRIHAPYRQISLYDSDNSNYEFEIESNDGLFKIMDRTMGANRLTISSNGDVGIGTNTPDSAFQVDGPIATAIKTVTSAYTVTDSDSIILCSSAYFTVSLPSAVGIAGRMYTIKRAFDNIAPGTIVVDPYGSERIDGASNYNLGTTGYFVVIVSDGANWVITGEKKS